jgi:hypothetical protein
MSDEEPENQDEVSESDGDADDFDILGRPRSPAARRGYHRGRSPRNKGRKLPAEALTPEEVDDLMSAASPRGPAFESRDRAMLWLMYRGGLKISEVVALDRPHFSADDGTLFIERRREALTLDTRSLDLLNDWMRHRKDALGTRLSRTAPLFCTILGNKLIGRRLEPSTVRQVITARADRAHIERRVTPEGLRKSGQSHAAGRTTGIGAFVDEEAFARRYRAAYDRWRDGQALFNISPDRYAGNIGLACRAAMIDFAARFAELHGVAIDAPPTSTVVRIRRVLLDNEHRLSEGVARFAERVLVPYWGTVWDLVQRQVHEAGREGESLTRADAERILFQTFAVMYELDRSVPVRAS